MLPALIVAGVLAAAASTASAEPTCRTGCGGVVPQTFKFAEGTTYQYNYEGVLEVLLASGKTQGIETKVKATVLLTQQSECNQILRLQNVQILGDEKRFGSIQDIEKPIRLNYHDGHLEDIICAEAGDTQNSLNVKRAIASMFQAALKHHNSETDIFGVCPTDFSTHKEGNVFVIKKARNLNKCSHRETLGHGYFDLDSDVKTSPLLQGKLNSELRIKAGILDSAIVDEDYLYMPFSVGDKGAKAKVRSRLNLIKQTKESPKVSCSIPKSILFENPHEMVSSKSLAKVCSEEIKSASNGIEETLESDTAEKFSKILHLLRQLKKSEIITLYGQIRSGAGFKNQAIARKMFMDALFRAGTGDAVEAGFELYKNNEMSEIESKLFFLRLSFMKHSTLGAIKASTDLLGKNDISYEAMIGLGSVIKRYCDDHQCENIKEIDQFFDKLSTKINKCKTHQDEEKLMAVLKSVLNAKMSNENLNKKLITLAEDTKEPMRIRSQVLNSYKSNPCNHNIKDSAIKILTDQNEDSELRIRAYLALVDCPCQKVAKTVKNLIDKEEVNQVGGFIVSHLRTLRASTNPDKHAQKEILGNIRTVKSFPFDLGKFSNNFETSQRWDSIGLGGSLETNLIYSKKSFIPRVTSFNMTTQIFGHNLNFLEIESRQENFETVLEKYLGPMGMLRNKDLYKESPGKIKSFVESIKEKIVQKRETSKNQIESFAKNINTKENELNKDLEFDLSLKMFGSEVLFLTLSEDVSKMSITEFLEKISKKIDQEIEKLNQFDENLNQNLLFLDTEIAYPTSTGFPLKLETEGISSLKLKTSGKLNLKEFLRGRPGNYKLSLIPSASIRIQSRMVIDTPVITRGLKINGNLFTSTGGAFDLKFTRNSIEFDYSLPIKNQEILTATHEIVFESRDPSGECKDIALKQTQPKAVTVCLDRLNPYLGVTFCANLNQPDVVSNGIILPYPLNGNSKFSITVENTDLGKVGFKGVLHDGSGPIGVELETTIYSKQNTPKSSLKTEGYLRPEIYLLTTFNSEKKKASAELRVVSTDEERSVFGKAKVDEIEYYAKVGLFISQSGAKQIMKPIFEYKAGTGSVMKSPYRIEGQIIKENLPDNCHKYTLDNIQLVGLPKPIKINGKIDTSSKSISSDLQLTDGAKSGEFKSKVAVGGDELHLNAMLNTNFNPNANFDLKYNLKIKENSFDSNLQFQHKDLTAKDNIFKLKNYFERNSPKEFLPMKTKNFVSYPRLGMENKFNMELGLKSAKIEVTLGYQKAKISCELDAKLNANNVGDYDIDFEFEGMNTKLELDLERAVDKNNIKSKLKNSLEVNGKSIKLNGDVIHNFDTNKVDFGTDLTLKVSGFPQHNCDVKILSTLKTSPQELDASLKVTNGPKAVVDAFMKQTKGGNLNGSLKVNSETAKVQGQLKAAKFAGTSDLSIEIPNVRKIKGSSTFNVNLPTVNLDLTLMTDVGKDDSRKYRISTNNVIKEDSIDTKNILEILGKTTTFNMKGTKDGTIKHGKINGEMDLTLPNEMYFAAKIDRDVRVLKGVINGAQTIVFEQRDNKNTPGRKLTIKGKGTNVDVEHGSYDIKYQAIFENGNGKNFNLDLDLKAKNEGQKQGIDWEANLVGSGIEPMKTKIILTIGKELVGDFDIKFNKGNDLSFDLTGKYEHHHHDDSSHPCHGELSLEIKTPLKKFKLLKMNSKGQFSIPKKPEDTFELTDEFDFCLETDDAKEKIDFKAKQNWKLHSDKGEIKSTLESINREPLEIEIDYDRKQMTSKGLVKYGAKFGKINIDLDKVSDSELKGVVKLATSDERLKNLDLSGNFKSDKATKVINEDLKINFNGQNYEVQSEVGLSEHNPEFMMSLKHPNGDLDKILFKFNNIGIRSVSTVSEIKIARIPFHFDGSLNVRAEKIEDFDLDLKLNSPQLKLNKIAININTKESRGTNKLMVSWKKDKESVITGSCNYKTREEDGKFIIEGSGTFTVKNEKKSGNFKYTKNNLVLSKNKEEGVEISLQGSIGDKALDSEIKFTDKHQRSLISYCEQKKDCFNVELDSKTLNENDNYKNVLEANVDLRKLGLSHEFGLKSETNVKAWDFDHNFDVHFQNKNSKYSYSLNLHPEKSGISFETPKRIVALESILNRPKLGHKGPIKGEVCFYMNKKTKPNEKAAWSFEIDPVFDDKMAVLKMESKFVHPALKKPMLATHKSELRLQSPYSLTVHEEVDIIPNSDKKVILNGNVVFNNAEKKPELKYSYQLDVQPLKLKITGDGVETTDTEKMLYEFKHSFNADICGHKSESGYFGYYCLTKITEKMKINNRQLYDVDFDMKLNPNEQLIKGQMKLLNLDPVAVKFETKNKNSIKASISKASGDDPKLELNSAFIPNQIIDFRVDLVKSGKKIDLIHSSLKLDDANFMKSDYNFDSKSVKENVFEPLKALSHKVFDESKKAVKETIDDSNVYVNAINKEIQSNQANMKPLEDYYQKEFNSIKDEIEADETIKKINEELTKVIKALMKFAEDMTKISSEFLTKMNEIFGRFFKNIGQTFETEFAPKLKELAHQLSEAYFKILEKSNELAFKIAHEFSIFLEAHKNEIKQAMTVVTSLSQDANRFLVKFWEELKKTLHEDYKVLLEEIKAMPGYEKIKEIVEKLNKGEAVPEDIVRQFEMIAQEISNNIALAPIKEIFDHITSYLVKKMRGQQCDDMKEIEKLVEMVSVLVKELINEEGMKQPNLPVKSTVPVSVRLAGLIPKFVLAQFSGLNRILNKDLPTIDELIYGLTLNPLSWVPPYRRYATLAQGQHVFTFDGRHMTFPGKCNYMLAREVTGRFSVVGTYSDGILTELSLNDKTSIITIKKTGAATLNGQAHELPIRTGVTDAFRLYDRIEVHSDAGIRIFCLPDLTVCVFSVSGFYHDRLRGLLGNPNFEPSDDFLLPSGKMAKSESDFGNAYKMKDDCPSVKCVDHSTHAHNEKCSELFGNASPLSLCYPFVKKDIFRQACDHGMSAKVGDTLETIAMAYSATCWTKYALAIVPKDFVKCTNSEKPFKLGETFSVKTPQKAADIVLAVDVTQETKEFYTDMIVPLGDQLKKDLSERGIKDVEFHMITYGGDQPKYPSHITTGGGKMTFKGKFPTLKFTEAVDDDFDFSCGIKQIDFLVSLIQNFVKDVKLALGETPQEWAYDEAIEYPFRTNAVKAIIAVTNKPCETGSLIWGQKLRALLLHNPAVSINIFTPMEGANFKVKDDKTTKTVIGFNEDNVMTFPDCKKKPLGNPDLVKDVSYNDYCSEFTAMGGGNVFVVDNFKPASKANKKLYTQIASYNIAENMLAFERKMDCSCKRVDQMFARNECTVVEEKKRPPSDKKLTRG